MLPGEVKDVLLLDVTPLTLGVETLGSLMTPIIERNTTIPVRKSEAFSTAEDGHTMVTIHVLQGERPMAADDVSLGQFNLEGLPPAPRGVPQIEVTFEIDANGILNVSARDKATDNAQQVTITATTNLTEEEVDRLVREAKRHEAQDQQRRSWASLFGRSALSGCRPRLRIIASGSNVWRTSESWLSSSGCCARCWTWRTI